MAAALLPLLTAVASIAAALGDTGWAGISAPLVRAVTPDAVLYTAACAVVAAPLGGVAVAAQRRTAIAIARPLATATAVFCAVSAALTAGRLGGEAGSLELVFTSHAVLAAVTLALAVLGAMLGTLVRDPLDAAALAVGAALAAAFGLLVAGAPVAEWPAPVLEAATLASPMMTVATAAHVDLVRSDVWYQISPLAHVTLNYPAWTTACATYLLAGCVGFAAIAWRRAGHGAEPGQIRV